MSIGEKISLQIIVWIFWHGVNIFLAWQNKQVVQKRLNHKDLRQIEHGLWFAGYCLICVPFYWIGHIGLWFVLGLICQHGSIFPVAYNDYRGLAPFNLSKTSKSSFDKLQVKLGLKSSELVNFGCEVLALAFLGISVVKNIK